MTKAFDSDKPTYVLKYSSAIFLKTRDKKLQNHI